MMMMIRRSKTIKDTEGGVVSFDEITMNGHSVHTAVVNNAISREVPVGPIFDAFGRNAIIKTDYSMAANAYRLSVMDASTYSHDGEGTVVTYGDLKSTMESYPNGECVDGVICASYDGDGLTFEPYVYDWKSLTIILKILRALLVALTFSIVVYLAKDTITAFKEIVLFGMLVLKDNVFSLATRLFFL